MKVSAKGKYYGSQDTKEIVLTQIADEAGFVDQSHFNHTFRRYFNVSPGRY